LHILAVLDTETGSVRIDGTEITTLATLPDQLRASTRSSSSSFNLLPMLPVARENLLFAVDHRLPETRRVVRRFWSDGSASAIGCGTAQSELSGGQHSGWPSPRALVSRPTVVFAERADRQPYDSTTKRARRSSS